MKKTIILGLATLFAHAYADTDLTQAQNTFQALAHAREALTQAKISLEDAQKDGSDTATATNELVQAQNACDTLIAAQSAAIMLGVKDSKEQKTLDTLVQAQIAVADNPEDEQEKRMLNALVNAQIEVANAKKEVKGLPDAQPAQAKPYLWVYWESAPGTPMPGYISLCRKTLLKHCKDSFNIVQLDNNNIYDYLPGLREKEQKFKVKLNTLFISQKVDYYRLLLLHKYGGLYFDADMIVMQDLKPLVEKLKNYDYVGFGCYDHVGFGDCAQGKGNRGYGFPDNWAMVSRPQGTLISRVLRNVENKLLNDTINDYFDLGRGAIWEEMQHLFAHNYHYYHCPSDFDGSRDENGNWVDPRAMFRDDQFTYKDFDKILFFLLFNSTIPDEYKKMSEDELLESETSFAKYVKMSLGLADKSKEEQEQKPYLWVYWECVNGAPMPGYISLCRKTLLRHCKDSFNIVELDEKNIYDHLPELREKEKKFKVSLNSLKIPQKVDYYRVLLLHKYGGLYFDSDMLVMRDLKELVKQLDHYDYIGWGRNVDHGPGDEHVYGRPENGVMASKPGGILISRILRNQEKKLLNHTVTDYYDLGRNAVREEMRHLFAYNYRYYHCPSDLENCLYPGSMFTDERFSYNDFSKVLFFVLFNNSISDEYKKMTEEQLLASDMLFTQVAKISLGL